jgi:hypothetical protein
MNYAKIALLLVRMAAILIWIGSLIGGPTHPPVQERVERLRSMA